MECSISEMIDPLLFSIANNIDNFITLNERGKELKIFHELQAARLEDLHGTQSLAQVVPQALRHSALGPFLYEYNAPACLQAQQHALQMIKFFYCKEREAWLDAKTDIFPHIQHAIAFIEDALVRNRDGKITLQYVYDTLRVMNLSDKRISELDDTLAKFKNLQYLNLSWNQIETMAMFQIPPCLFYLNFDMNFLSDVILCPSGRDLSFLVYLNLSRNKFSDDSDIRGINSLPNLLILDLSYNEIHQLNTLWRDLFTEKLKVLQSLSMIGNPCSVTKDYFVNVIAHMPRLQWLDNLSIADDVKINTPNRYDRKEENEAELCIQLYRVLQFKMEQNITLPDPKLSDLEKSPKSKSKIGKKKKKKTPKRKKKRAKSKGKNLEVPKESRPPSPPAQALEIFYRFELECPILDETLHDFVDFVMNAECEDEQIPNEILEKMKTDKVTERGSVKSILSENEGQENTKHEITVGEAKALLKELKLGGSEDVSKVFNTRFLSNMLPESPIMEFSPILIKAPRDNLKLLSNMFYTQLKLHFVQILTKPQIVENNKRGKKKKSEKGKSKKAWSESMQKPLLEPEIVERKILYTIILDQLAEPTWAEESIDLAWTPFELTRSANLKHRIYRKYSSLSKKDLSRSKNSSQGNNREALPLPEKLTMHFGISLKRAHKL